MTFIVQSIKIRKSPAVLFVALVKERDFNECEEFSEMGSGLVAV